VATLWLAACQRKRLRFLRFLFTQRTQRKRLRLNGNRAWFCGDESVDRQQWPGTCLKFMCKQARRSHQLTLTIYGYTPMTSCYRLSTEFPVLACGHVLVRSSWESYGCCLTRASVRRTFALVLMRGRYSVWPKVSARYHAMTSHVNNRAYIAHLHTALQISFITLYKARNTRLIYAYYICYLSIRKFSSNNLKMIFFDSLPRELRNQPICKILSSAVK